MAGGGALSSFPWQFSQVLPKMVDPAPSLPRTCATGACAGGACAAGGAAGCCAGKTSALKTATLIRIIKPTLKPVMFILSSGFHLTQKVIRALSCNFRAALLVDT